MRIDQLALLFALVIAVNVVLLAAVELPRFGRRAGRGTAGQFPATTDRTAGAGAMGGAAEMAPGTGERADARLTDGLSTPLPTALYQRVVRVVSFLFVGSALAIATLGGATPEPALQLLLVAGLFLIVIFEDVLPATSLGRMRLRLEALTAIVFVTLLLILTGGVDSPYYFGYVLVLLAAASVWASGFGPPLLAVLTSTAYLVGVVVAAGFGPLSPETLGRVAFNLVALALVTYVASVVGREQRRAREAALRLSRVDSLTGLYNRDYFKSAIEQEIARAARSGRPFGLLMIDLDGLKAANDRFGHAAGDRLLQAVGEVIRGDSRVTDVVVRYAGDEFVLLLPDTDLAGALNVADKVRVDIARLALPNDGAVIRSSASVGVVTYPDDGRTSSELIRRADLAMYEAKRRGRDQIVRYAREVTVPMGQAPAAGAAQTTDAGIGEAPPQGRTTRRTRTQATAAGQAADDILSQSPGPAPWEEGST